MADRGLPTPKLPTVHKPAKITTPAPQGQANKDAAQHVQEEPVQNPLDEVPNQVPPPNPPAQVLYPVQSPNTSSSGTRSNAST